MLFLAKEKIDLIKRSVRQTGGGPAPPPLTSAEEALANSLDGRPIVEGIDGGIDTDGTDKHKSITCYQIQICLNYQFNRLFHYTCIIM